MKVLLFKFRCNIFIGVRIIKEMPGSVASGTLCIKPLFMGNKRNSCTNNYSALINEFNQGNC